MYTNNSRTKVQGYLWEFPKNTRETRGIMVPNFRMSVVIYWAISSLPAQASLTTVGVILGQVGYAWQDVPG